MEDSTLDLDFHKGFDKPPEPSTVLLLDLRNEFQKLLSSYFWHNVGDNTRNKIIPFILSQELISSLWAGQKRLPSKDD
ncbi:unnamed protein product [Allacma fusca]|uniref:Uncharacterized protein n=1 Tax=Allacma fusca TaxID=39272 RepID=A0A8J2K5N8_9HEXA|nr:unnamed protein product [Allacma fusca]